jgi:hypothetical protein
MLIMKKLFALFLFASCSMYGMEEPNCNAGTEVFVRTCANMLKESDPNLSHKEAIDHLRKSVPDKASLLRGNCNSFINSIASELSYTGLDYLTRRAACNQALKKLSNEQLEELRYQGQ